LLVLKRIVDKGKVKVAQLVRSKETRSPGSFSSNTGNSGRLKMYLDKKDKERIINKLIVVSIVLVILKKEVNKQRAIQVAIISVIVLRGAY
jgi:hypothetical protein